MSFCTYIHTFVRRTSFSSLTFLFKKIEILQNYFKCNSEKNIFMSSIQVSQTLSTSSASLCCHEYGSVSVCYRVRGEIYCEIEELGLLLVGASLGQAGFAEVSVWYAGFDRLGGTAVLEALGHVVVLHVHHVLDGAEGGFWRLFHLEVRQRIVL